MKHTHKGHAIKFTDGSEADRYMEQQYPDTIKAEAIVCSRCGTIEARHISLIERIISGMKLARLARRTRKQLKQYEAQT